MADSELELLIALLLVVITLVALAKRVNISYPIVLVLGGLALGFVPNLPKIHLDPDVVLLIFVPPLLYWEAIIAPTDIMFENAGQISVLAVGLVIVTTAAVALIAHLFIPGMPWAVAFILGAIVSPTDELAAVPILEHFGLPRHVIAIAEGESLLNDATALVIYATAITVVLTGAFNLPSVLFQFILTVAGSFVVGYLAGRLGVELWRHIKDAGLQAVISVVMPFLAYLPAKHFGFSGVLAVVVAGVYANRFTPRVVTPAARTQIAGFWSTLVFIVNAVLFLVVGLQLHDVARAAFERNSWQVVVGSSAAVNIVVIVVRLMLVVLAEYAPTAAPPDHAAPNWKNALVVAWSGLRGAVSLAAALAIPLIVPGGTPFPQRDLIVFVTFTVILVTLVGGGLTLPFIVRRLRIEGGSDEGDEIRRALIRSAEAALTRISELELDGRIDTAHAETLRRKFEHRRELQHVSESENNGAHLTHDANIEREMIAVQRMVIIEMRERGEIDNVVLRRLQADLDMSASRPALQARD